MSPEFISIAIDGPASSGKSTVGQLLARELGFLFFDTGVLYRAVTAVALQRGLDLHDETTLATLSRDLDIDLLPPTVDDGRLNTVLIDNRDVTWNLRTPDVDANVSIVAALPAVRTALTEQMRTIGHRHDVVMVGRDIGTVVMPDADLKVFLSASLEERARRRFEENLARGDTDRSYAQILAGLQQRDQLDTARDTAPLIPAHDAIKLDTTDLSVGEVIERVQRLLKQIAS